MPRGDMPPPAGEGQQGAGDMPPPAGGDDPWPEDMPRGDMPPPAGEGQHQEGDMPRGDMPPPAGEGQHQEGEQQGGGSDGGLGALETAMGPEPDTAGANAGEPDSLDDAVGQAMDANTDQGGPPAGDPGTHIEPDVGGEPDDFAPDEADESTSEPDLGD